MRAPGYLVGLRFAGSGHRNGPTVEFEATTRKSNSSTRSRRSGVISVSVVAAGGVWRAFRWRSWFPSFLLNSDLAWRLLAKNGKDPPSVPMGNSLIHADGPHIHVGRGFIQGDGLTRHGNLP